MSIFVTSRMHLAFIISYSGETRLSGFTLIKPGYIRDVCYLSPHRPNGDHPGQRTVTRLP